VGEQADELFLSRALGRIYRILLALGAAGVLAATLWRGWRWGLGFLAGAAFSAVNFRGLHQLAVALEPGSRSPRRRVALFLLVRLLAFGGGAYVIVKYLGAALPALLAGLFVAVAAVILEILYELIYART